MKDTITSIVDAKDANGFAALFADNGQFIFGNNDAVIGRDSIQNYVDGFFSLIQGLKHTSELKTQTDNLLIFTGEVTYTRKDGSTLTLPYCNVLDLEQNKISKFQVYVDNSALFQ